MAALLRCTARRLGGSLLQRTPAAERRQLFSPSRLLIHTSEHVRGDFTREIQHKKKEMYDAISKWERDSMAIGAAQRLSIQVNPKQPLSAQVTQGPVEPQSWKVYLQRAWDVFELVAKATIFVYASAFVLAITGMGKKIGLTRERIQDWIED